MEIPEILRLALDGLPRHGHPEAAIPLLSTDDAGWPHVCLLSRAQLAARDGGVCAVVTSRETRSNIVNRGVATLLLITPLAAHYCKVRLVAMIEEDWALTASCDLISVKVDHAPMGLTPILYTPSLEIEQYEQWGRSVELLKRSGGRGLD